MSVRCQPEIGASVVVIYLGARAVGRLTAVEDSGRRLVVATEEGAVVEFALNPATGHFSAGGRQWDARLLFDDRGSGTRVTPT